VRCPHSQRRFFEDVHAERRTDACQALGAAVSFSPWRRICAKGPHTTCQQQHCTVGALQGRAMKVSYDLLNTCAVETPGAALPADESERLAALGELDLVDHDDPALESL